MSRTVALDNIFLRPSARWAHTEYSFDYHRDYIARLAPEAAEGVERTRAAYNRCGFDFLWHTDSGMIDWTKTGRTTDMGHADYAADGADRRTAGQCPFKTMEEVWAFDAVGEYGLPDFEEQVQAYEDGVRSARRRFPDQLTTGGYYKTLVSGAVEAFGWEMLLLAASDAGRMEKVLDSFYRRTLFHMRAWARTSVEVVVQHDDFVWSSGAFMRPDFYRRVIIPRYAELWKPLHEAGKKVLFCSDGDFTQFAADVAEAGADGFIFEPCMDFQRMAADFGDTHCLVGSFVDCRDLAFAREEKVRADMDRTFEALNACKGAIVAVGNHLAPNIPAAMLDEYFQRLAPRLRRDFSVRLAEKD